ncbi:MAG: rubrerythrin family protein [Anaerolineae bacterium]
MHSMTAENLRSAFGGESMAHMRYLIWADKADQDGFPNIARLFRAISFAEQVHATGHFNVLKEVVGGFNVTAGGGFGLGSTAQNLQGAIDGERFEVEEMYPAYMAVAESQGEKAAHRSMSWAWESEKQHVALYTQAKQAADSGKDVDFGTVYVCEVCGHTVVGAAPDKCPVCNMARDRFRAFA